MIPDPERATRLSQYLLHIILQEKEDLPGIVRLVSRSPDIIFLPPCDVSHIPGCLDPVASHAEDLQVIPGPLVTSHGDRPDVVKDVMMILVRTSGGVGFIDRLPADGTSPSLFVPDKPPHSGDRRPFFEPVLHTAGGLTAEGMPVSRIEVYSLAAAMGTGTSGDPLLFFRSILAIFTHHHIRSHLPDPFDVMTHIFLPGPDNTGAGWVKVFRAMSISGAVWVDERRVDPAGWRQWSLWQMTARNVTGFVMGMRGMVRRAHRKTKPATSVRYHCRILFRTTSRSASSSSIFLTGNDSGIERTGYIYLVIWRSGCRVQVPGEVER